MQYPKRVSQKTINAIQVAENTSVTLAPTAAPLKTNALLSISWAKIAAFFTSIATMMLTFEHTSDLLTQSSSFIEAPIEMMTGIFANTSALSLISGSIGTASYVMTFLLGLALTFRLANLLNNFIQTRIFNILTHLRLPVSFINLVTATLSLAGYIESFVYGFKLISPASALVSYAVRSTLWYALPAIALSFLALSVTLALNYLICKALKRSIPAYLLKLDGFLRRNIKQFLSQMKASLSLSDRLTKFFLITTLIMLSGYVCGAISSSGLAVGLGVALTLGLQGLLFNIVFATNKVLLNTANDLISQMADAIAFAKLVILEISQGNKAVQALSYREQFNLTAALNAFKRIDPFMKTLNSRFDINNVEHYRKFISFLIDHEYQNIFPILKKLGANKNDCNYHGREEWAAMEVLATLEEKQNDEETEENIEPTFPKRLSLQWQAAKTIVREGIPLADMTDKAAEIVTTCRQWYTSDQARRNGI